MSSENKSTQKSSASSHSKAERIAALVGVFVLAVMYLTALVCAFINHPMAQFMMMASLFCTITIPVLLYVFTMFFKKKKDRNTSETP